MSCPNTTSCVADGYSYNNSTGFHAEQVILIPMSGSSSAMTLPVLEQQPGSGLNAVGCATSSQCYVGGAFGIGMANGTSVVPVAFEVPGMSSISCGSSTNCVAVTSNGIAATNDGGKTWVNLPPIVEGNCTPQHGCIGPNEVACFSATGCLLWISTYGVYSNPGLYVTTNLGLTWTPEADPIAGRGGADFACVLPRRRPALCMVTPTIRAPST